MHQGTRRTHATLGPPNIKDLFYIQKNIYYDEQEEYLACTASRVVFDRHDGDHRAEFADEPFRCLRM